MKTTLIIFASIGTLLFIASCMTKKEENKTVKVNPNKLIPGPIQHKALSDEQMTQIKLIHSAFQEVYPISLE